MSRGFVKEDDQEEIPMVPQRAYLPEGVTNFVTHIVGVDEADISKGKISFISPLAKALINKKAGDKVILKRDQKDIVFTIMEITYN